ncbi:Uncharacterised protein [Mycobacteroides abscessus subsp. abscessus]|nr:Uncharacterised protein [Mycobacteroides abscessus subsp. abscessus]
MYLADAGRGDGLVVEGLEAFTPLRAQLGIQDAVDLVRGQRWGVALQLGQGLAVGLAEFGWDGCFHHREHLANLHGRALEFAEYLEELFGGFLHEFGVDFVLGLSGQAFPDTECGATGNTGRKRCEFCGARGAATTNLCHAHIMPARDEVNKKWCFVNFRQSKRHRGIGDGRSNAGRSARGWPDRVRASR